MILLIGAAPGDKGEVSREENWFKHHLPTMPPSNFPTDSSKAAPQAGPTSLVDRTVDS